MIDWRDPARRDDIRFVMVDPNNLDEVYGDLEDVQLGSTSITYGYYADTRYSSGISFLKFNNYVPNAWIRIIHDVPLEGYSNELGTFIPTSPSESWSGAVIIKLDLQSPLWGLKDDLLTSKLSIGKSTSVLNAFKAVCESSNRPFIFENPNDYRTTKAIVYAVGTSKLQVLFDLCDMTGNRMDLDGHGRIILSPDPDQTTLTPTWTLDADDTRSMIIQGSIEMDSEIDDLPSRAIVVNGNNVGVADLDAGIEYSAQQRGYIKAKKYDGKGNVQSLAKMYLDTASKIVHYKMNTLYFPCKCGENVTFILDGEKHICMIQSIDPLNLETMTMGLTLREIFYG